MDVSMEFGELIGSVEKNFFKTGIKKMDKTMLAKALKTIDPKISEKIFSNMNEDEVEELKKKISGLGTIRLEEVEAAQKEIIGIAKKK
jgi:flagellar motor switch protein FliG